MDIAVGLSENGITFGNMWNATRMSYLGALLREIKDKSLGSRILKFVGKRRPATDSFITHESNPDWKVYSTGNTHILIRCVLGQILESGKRNCGTSISPSSVFSSE